jgi:hypothetical protein
MAYHRPLWLLALAATSCALEDVPDEEGTPEESTTIQEASGCTNELLCGRSNSPEVDHLGVHDLFMNGAANENGFVITDFTKGTTHYTVSVKNGKLRGLDPAGNVALSGAALVTSEIRLKNVRNTSEYVIRVLASDPVNYWAKVANITRQTEAYRIVWAVIVNSNPGEFKPVCPSPVGDGNPDLLGLDRFRVVMFEDDVIDRRSRRVVGKDPTRFNIGCAGTVQAKLHMVGYSEGAVNQTIGQPNPYTASLAQKTAFVKAMAADYCGTPTVALTILGMPLTFENPPSYSTRRSPLTAPTEAMWTENGAICINDPRGNVHPLADLLALYPNGVKQEILNTCPARFVSCPAQPPPGVHWVTANLP